MSLAFCRTTQDSSSCVCVCTGEAFFFLLDGQLNLYVTHTLLSSQQETDSKKKKKTSPHLPPGATQWVDT